MTISFIPVTVCSLKGQFGKLVLFTDMLFGWYTCPCQSLSPKGKWVQNHERSPCYPAGSLVLCNHAEACAWPWPWDLLLVRDIELASVTALVWECAPHPCPWGHEGVFEGGG